MCRIPGRRYRVVIANMGSINPGVKVSGMPKYPGIADDYARTFASQNAMQIDVWLASHASSSGCTKSTSPAIRTTRTVSWIPRDSKNPLQSCRRHTRINSRASVT